MKIKLSVIREAGPVLVQILGNPIDPKLSYRISKIARKLSDELRLIEEARVKLVNEKYGEEQKDVEGKVLPGGKRVSEENMDAFVKEWEVFLDTETELEIQKIPFACLETKSGITCPKCSTVIREPLLISGMGMAILEPFIEAPKEEGEVTKVVEEAKKDV